MKKSPFFTENLQQSSFKFRPLGIFYGWISKCKCQDVKICLCSYSYCCSVLIVSGRSSMLEQWKAVSQSTGLYLKYLLTMQNVLSSINEFVAGQTGLVLTNTRKISLRFLVSGLTVFGTRTRWVVFANFVLKSKIEVYKTEVAQKSNNQTFWVVWMFNVTWVSYK